MNKIKSWIPQNIKNYYHWMVAMLANLYYGFPSQKIKVIGVTGTDGKTTTTSLIFHLLKTCGKKASMVTSVNAVIGDEVFDTGFHVTTPDPHEIPKLIAKAVKAGSEYIVLETTSHALDQHRVAGIDYQIGVLTNITHEHLDYHQNLENYTQAKGKLFKRAKQSVLNADDSSFEKIKSLASGKIISYGIEKPADLMAAHIKLNPLQTKFDLVIPQEMAHPKSDQSSDYQIRNVEKINLGEKVCLEYPIFTKLVGEFNISNILAALGCGILLELPIQEMVSGIENFKGVIGRMERIEHDQDFEIIIDFAHTPGAFEKVLPLVKEITNGRVIHVFGSAGLRDVTKRPKMGEISAAHADLVILTAEDPRTEDVNQIIDQIAEGCIKVGAKETRSQESGVRSQNKKRLFFKIPDRQKAIDFAIQKLAQKGDTVIITGKAHEKSMCFGETEHPWSEHEVVQRALNKNKGAQK